MTRPWPTSEHLAELWQPFLRRGSDEQLHDLATAIEQLGDRPGERLVVAEYDGEFAGAASTCGPRRTRR